MINVNFIAKDNAVSALYPIHPAGLENTVPPTPKVATPTATCVENVVTMECTTEGASIKYSVDGGTTYTEYSEPITITETTNYKVFATKEGMLDSDVLDFTATYVEPQTENE